MVTLFWAAKGGSGTTVVASLAALTASQPTLLIDLDGEAPAVLGIPDPDRPGVVDWLEATGAASQLDDLVVQVDETTSLLACRSTGWGGQSGDVGPGRWSQLIGWAHEWCRRHEGAAVIDAGTGVPPAALVEAADQVLLVSRSCFLSLRRAAAEPSRPDGVVVVAEAGRSLRRRDVARSIGAPVVATIDHDPAISRCVDAGLLMSRAPRGVRRTLGRLVGAQPASSGVAA